MTKLLGWIISKVAEVLNPQLFKAFRSGAIAGIRIKKFLNPHEAAAIAASIELFVEEYKSAVGVGKAGPALVEYHDFNEYRDHAEIWLADGIGLPEREELINKVCGFIALKTGMKVKALKTGLTTFYHGIFRKINSGAGIHIDDVTKDCNEFGDRPSESQFSVVVHLKAPEKGGETVLFDRTAQEGDKDFLTDSWQYSESLFQNVRSVEVPCIAGDMVILSTKNYHKVNPCIPVGSDRISFSFFMVIFQDEPDTIYIYN